MIIIESTIPVGTTSEINEIILKNTNLNEDEFHLVHCSERVIPGNIIYEIVNNSRVVGGLTDVASKKASDFYKSFVKGNVLCTNSQIAELVKLTENSFRDLNIAFSNEISMICHKLGINVRELISLANNHPRVNMLQPGCGVGGHCIAVDPWFIVSKMPEDALLIKKRT